MGQPAETTKYVVLRHTPPLTLSQVFEIIISECKNGCTDSDSTMRYFKKHHENQHNAGELGVLVRCLDFEAIRRIEPHVKMG